MGADGSRTATALSIWFPARDATGKRAFIVALDEDFHGAFGYEPQHFYALNGWEDVSIDFRVDANYSYWLHGGIMHCHTEYLDSCWFANNLFACDPFISLIALWQFL